MKNNNISEFNQDDAEWRRASYIIAAVIIYCGCKLMTGLEFFFMFFEMFKCSTFLSFFSMANPGLIDLIIQPK